LHKRVADSAAANSGLALRVPPSGGDFFPPNVRGKFDEWRNTRRLCGQRCRFVLPGQAGTRGDEQENIGSCEGCLHGNRIGKIAGQDFKESYSFA